MFDFCDIFAILAHCDVWGGEARGRKVFIYALIYRDHLMIQ